MWLFGEQAWAGARKNKGAPKSTARAELCDPGTRLVSLVAVAERLRCQTSGVHLGG